MAAVFDGLAENYDRYRPRYPEALAPMALGPRRTGLTVVDAGAGTGITLEWLLPWLTDATVHAVDLSEDMIRAGRAKLPGVSWHVGRVEDFLAGHSGVDLVVAGQAYQWFDRSAFLAAAREALAPDGRLAIVQNNRSYEDSPFLDAYESLLEQHSPGYARTYRDFDIVQELLDGLCPVRVESHNLLWHRMMAVEDFMGMAASSSKVQAALDAAGPGFMDRLRPTAQNLADMAGRVDVAYRTELFTAQLEN